MMIEYDVPFSLCQISPTPLASLSLRDALDFESAYKTLVLFFSLVDQLFSVVLSAAAKDNREGAQWSTAYLASWLRGNDDALLKLTSKVLRNFQVS